MLTITMKQSFLRTLALILFCLLSVQSVFAQETSVTLGGVIGNQAILSINGTPRTLSIGQEFQGVKLLHAQGQQATIQIQNAEGAPQKITLVVGQAPFTSTGASSGGGVQQTPAKPNNTTPRCTPAEQHVHVGRHGMFYTMGYINGRAVDFVVDTGATLISMSEKQALALGITNYKQGDVGTSHTANGSIPSYLITLDSVRIGGIELKNVRANVGGEKDIILLGNSFLSQLDIEMTPNRIILRKTCP